MSLLSTHTGILIDSTDAPNIPIPAILTNLRSTRSASDLRISCNSPSREASVCLLSVCQNSNSGKLLQTKAGIIPLLAAGLAAPPTVAAPTAASSSCLAT